MGTNYKFSKKILLTLTVTVIAATLAYILLFADNKSGVSTDINTNTTPSASSKVFVKDLHKHVNHETQDSIQRNLYSIVGHDKPDLYTATIRAGSHSRKNTPSKQTTIDMLIDIELVNLTYKVSLVGQNESYSINITCAPTDQQVNTSSNCVNNRHP